MSNFELQGSFTATPDPDFQSYGTPVRGFFGNGKPVRQGWESGVLKFPPLASGAFNELSHSYHANKNAAQAGKIPRVSGYGWRTVTAYWHEPLPTGWDGEWAHGVQMLLTKIIGT